MKNLIFLMLLSQSVCANDVVEKLAWLDQQRAQQNKATAEQLAQLNFLRMKILGVRKDADALTTSSAEIVKNCTRNAPTEKIEICYGRLSESIQIAELKNYEMEQLILSSHYQDIRRKNTELQTEFESLIRDIRGVYSRYLDGAVTLRKAVGLHLARVRFAKQLAQTEARANKTATDVACRLAPLNMRKDLLASEVLPKHAERDVNPFLIVKAESLARLVLEQAEALAASCPGRQADLAQIKSKAEKSLKALPSLEQRQQIARRTCKQLEKDLDPELKSACKEEVITPAVMYSLDRVIRRKATL